MIEDSLLLLKEFIVLIETREMEKKNQVGKNLMISKQTPPLPSYTTILDKGLLLKGKKFGDEGLLIEFKSITQAVLQKTS